MTAQHTPGPVLAKDHMGMRVDYQGMLGQSRRALGRSEPMLAEMLRQLQDHIKELGQLYYQGDAASVDEFLQLYCVEKDARCAAISKATGAV
jgi:hypothetical protein